MGDLSPHFSRYEFRDRRTGFIPEVDPYFIGRLEDLRRLIGNRPLPIISGWRSWLTNLRVRGARRSQHRIRPCRAGDIPSGIATVDQAKRAGFTGIGHRNGWVVHLDTRPGEQVVFED